MVKGSALRMGVLVSPVLVIPDCTISTRDLATAGLVALPISYAIALVILALFVRLWQRKSEPVDVKWTWQLGCGVVLLLALPLGFIVDRDLLVMALVLETPFVVALLCGGARLALALDSKILMCCTPILVAASLSVPNVLVFIVDPVMGSRIIDLELFTLANLGGWFWRGAVLALVIEAIVVRLSGVRAGA